MMKRTSCAAKRTAATSLRQGTKIPEPAKPLKPAQCRAFMRRHLAEAFPRIVEGFLCQAETGSCNHVKLASELLEPRRKASAGASRKDSMRDAVQEWKRRMNLI